MRNGGGTLRVAVKGAGMYGCVTAHQLQKAGYDVRIHVGGHGMLRGASANNFRRLHRGYHYPFSMTTAQASYEAHDEFVEEYGEFCRPMATTYWIAKDSSINYEDYIHFVWDLENGKEHRLVGPPNHKIEGGVQVFESTYRLDDMRRFFANELDYTTDEPEGFVIDCTYVDSPLAGKMETRKTTTLLIDNHRLEDRAQTVLYGPFCGYIPAEEGGFILYHAIHTEPRDILEAAEEFFPEIRQSVVFDVRRQKHVRPFGNNDARPYLIEQTDDREISVLGGKVAQSLNAAREVHQRLDGLGLMPD